MLCSGVAVLVSLDGWQRSAVAFMDGSLTSRSFFVHDEPHGSWTQDVVWKELEDVCERVAG